MKLNRFTWSFCLIAELLFILAGLAVIDILIVRRGNKIKAEISTLRADIEAQGEFIAQLQMEIEATTAATNWMVEKIDKRRVLIPVLNGDVYKIVEVESDLNGLGGAPDEHRER